MHITYLLLTLLHNILVAIPNHILVIVIELIKC